MIEYIAYQRFNKNSLSGLVDIPQSAVCHCNGNIIFYDNKPICAITSENAHKHFAINNDGSGLLRGKLIQAIQDTLRVRDENHQARWDKIWEDSLCQKYKNKNHADHWLWNHDFYNADIMSLRHIATLINAKEVA